MYKIYNWPMVTTTASVFRAELGTYLDIVQREPVEITSRGVRRRAVLVSPKLFDAAIQALENQQDIVAARAARREQGRVSREELDRELGF